MANWWDTSTAPVDPGVANPNLNLTDPSKGYAGYSGGGVSSSSTSGSSLMAASMFAGAMSSVAGAISQAGAIKAQGVYQSTLASTNAKIAQLESSQVIAAGDVAVSRQQLKTQQTVGAVKAAQGASGVDVASGSAAAVRAGMTGASRIDELTIRNNAARQAWGYQMQAMEDTYAGQFATLTSKDQVEQTLLTGGLQAISTPLSIGANYLRWTRMLGGSGSGNAIPYNMSTN